VVGGPCCYVSLFPGLVSVLAPRNGYRRRTKSLLMPPDRRIARNRPIVNPVELDPNPGLAVVGEHWFAGRGRFLRGEHSRPWYRPVSAAHVVPGWLHGCMGCVPAAFVLSISLIGMRDWAFAALR